MFNSLGRLKGPSILEGMLSRTTRAQSRKTHARHAIFVILLAMTAPVATQATAAPRADLESVRAQVRDLQMQAAAAHERAEQARIKLQEVQQELAAIKNRRKRERDDMRVGQAALSDFARALYAGGGIDPTLEVLLADDPAQFLAQAALIDQISTTQAAQLRGIQTARLRLAQTEAAISDRERAAKKQREAMRIAKNDMDDRLAAVEITLARLEKRDRERLQQIERERRLEQQKAAQETSRQSSGPGTQTTGGGLNGGSRAMAAVRYALAQVGEPYSYSAKPPNSWDCSKLTTAAWSQVGVGLTPLSYTQWNQTRRVPVSQIQPGDLVFYFGRGAHHVAIYVGNGKMVSASNPGDGVELIDFLGPWYRERFSGVGRVVG